MPLDSTPHLPACKSAAISDINMAAVYMELTLASVHASDHYIAHGKRFSKIIQVAFLDVEETVVENSV